MQHLVLFGDVELVLFIQVFLVESFSKLVCEALEGELLEAHSLCNRRLHIVPKNVSKFQHLQAVAISILCVGGLFHGI